MNFLFVNAKRNKCIIPIFLYICKKKSGSKAINTKLAKVFLQSNSAPLIRAKNTCTYMKYIVCVYMCYNLCMFTFSLVFFFFCLSAYLPNNNFLSCCSLPTLTADRPTDTTQKKKSIQLWAKWEKNKPNKNICVSPRLNSQ